MTWSTRLRLISCLLVVVLLSAGLTLVLNRRTGQAASTTATIRAETLDVGTDYPGTVVKTFVEEGDEVKKGDPLVRVRSLSLQHDLSVKLVSDDASVHKITKGGTITFAAPVDGVVTTVGSRPGSYVQSGAVLASVERSGSLFVDALLTLDADDLARLRDDADVTIVLPNQTEIAGSVEGFSVETAADKADTQVTVDSDGLVRGGVDGLVASGTPVSAVVTLYDDGPLAGAGDTFDAFLRRVGL